MDNEKWLVTLELRYLDAPKNDDGYTQHITKTITIGIYDNFQKACDKGNEMLQNNFETRFKLNPHLNKKERFSKNVGCFGGKKTLITNLGYLNTSFDFFAKITRLDFGNVDDIINDALNCENRYKAYKNNNM